MNTFQPANNQTATYAPNQTAVNFTQYNPENTIMNLNNDNMNIIKTNFLSILESFTHIKIESEGSLCSMNCHLCRTNKVYGINPTGDKQLIMTAAQESINCKSYGYMLIYRTANNDIFAALGYQKNPDCCGLCMPYCLCLSKKSRCECKNRECECDCDCCKVLPIYLTDLRLLNTKGEAFDEKSGVIASSFYNLFELCGFNDDLNLIYKNCGEKYLLQNQKCWLCDSGIDIINQQTKQKYTHFVPKENLCSKAISFDFELPADANPMEKLLIISQVFLYIFHRKDKGKNDILIDKDFL